MAINVENKPQGKSPIGPILAVLGVFGLGGVLVWQLTKEKDGTGTGILQVTVDPAGATLKIDGVSKTVGSITLPVGAHTWIVSATGYVTKSGQVTITKGVTLPLNVVLEDSGTGEEPVYTMSQPIATPNPVNMGENVSIKIPVKYTNGPATQAVTVKIEIAESSGLSTPGTLLKTLNQSTTLTRGTLKNLTFSWTSSGAIGSKDITVSILVSNAVKDSNHFDDAFDVSAGETQANLDLTFSPSTAYFELDGTTRLYNGDNDISAGYHTWECRQLGKVTQNGSFTVAAGAVKTLNITLAESISIIRVTNSPVTVGGVIDCTIEGFNPNTDVSIYLVNGGQRKLGTIHTSSAGWGDSLGQIIFPSDIAAGTYTLKASDTENEADTILVAESGQVILNYFWVNVRNWTQSMTHFAAQYHDGIAGQWIDGGIHERSGFAGFYNVHPRGTIAIMFSWDNGATWGDWIYSPSVTIPESSNIYYNWTSGRFEWEDGTPL
jgi:hypothetical protein